MVLDLLLAAIVLLGALSGWRRGFILAALDLLSLAVGLFVAFAGHREAAALIDRHVAPMSVWTPPLAFLLLYLLARLALSLVFGRMLRSVPERAHAHGGNRFLGVLPGSVNGAVNAAVVAWLLLALPLSGVLAEATRESRWVHALAQPAEWLEVRLSPIFGPAVNRTLRMITVPPESRERVDLPFTVAGPAVRADLEARMLALVNRARAEQGLRPLAADPQIAEVARAHSRDMFARGYFSHVTPEGKDPFDRLHDGRVGFRAAGENLALAPTITMAHEILMRSPGHRANVLRPAFGRLGVGVLDGGRHGLMVTQMFRN